MLAITGGMRSTPYVLARYKRSIEVLTDDIAGPKDTDTGNHGSDLETDSRTLPMHAS